jgi:hypothetical protein
VEYVFQYTTSRDGYIPYYDFGDIFNTDIIELKTKRGKYGELKLDTVYSNKVFIEHGFNVFNLKHSTQIFVKFLMDWLTKIYSDDVEEDMRDDFYGVGDNNYIIVEDDFYANHPLLSFDIIDEETGEVVVSSIDPETGFMSDEYKEATVAWKEYVKPLPVE